MYLSERQQQLVDGLKTILADARMAASGHERPEGTADFVRVVTERDIENSLLSSLVEYRDDTGNGRLNL